MSGLRILVGCKRVIDYAVKVSVISRLLNVNRFDIHPMSNRFIFLHLF